MSRNKIPLGKNVTKNIKPNVDEGQLGQPRCTRSTMTNKIITLPSEDAVTVQVEENKTSEDLSKALNNSNSNMSVDTSHLGYKTKLSDPNLSTETSNNSSITGQDLLTEMRKLGFQIWLGGLDLQGKMSLGDKNTTNDINDGNIEQGKSIEMSYDEEISSNDKTNNAGTTGISINKVDSNETYTHHNPFISDDVPKEPTYVG